MSPSDGIAITLNSHGNQSNIIYRFYLNSLA